MQHAQSYANRIKVLKPLQPLSAEKETISAALDSDQAFRKEQVYNIDLAKKSKFYTISNHGDIFIKPNEGDFLIWLHPKMIENKADDDSFNTSDIKKAALSKEKSEWHCYAGQIFLSNICRGK